MKNFLLIVLSNFILFTANANQAKQALKHGNYAKAFNLAYTKVQYKTWRPAFTHILEEAYSKANKQDHLEIQKLYLNNNDADAERIFRLFTEIKRRQDLVKILGNVQHKKSNIALVFPMIECETAVASYKNKTLEYSYNKATQLLNTTNRFDAREAYAELGKIESLQTNYKNTRALIAQAQHAGTSYVFIRLHNKSNVIMPRYIEEQLLNLNSYGLNKAWVVYHTVQQSNTSYQYTIDMNIRNIAISGENMNTKRYDQHKEVKDGFAYKLDANGNVMKDSLGNDIKIEKFKTITAHVKEFHQTKNAVIQADVVIIDNATKQIIQQAPIAYNYTWTNAYAEFRGEREALQNDATELSKNRFMPFPNNEAILGFTQQGLKDNFKVALLKQTPSII